MKIQFLKALLLMTAFFSLVSCSKDSDSPAPQPEIPVTGSYMRASVDGAAFTTKTSDGENVFVLKSGLGVQITGNSSALTKVIPIYIDGTPQVGTYTLTASSDSSLEYVEGPVYYNAAGCTGASGTITITVVTDTKVEGTFQFVGKDTDNCARISKTITNGSFRAVY